MSDRRTSTARLEDRLQARRNNFDILRLLAASLVLFSHSYVLTGNADPFGEVSDWTFGAVGVVMFFAMSGFLIAKSWSEQPHFLPFAAKRALRLLPALAVAVSVTVFVIGPLFTTLPLSSYFTDPTTWIYWIRSSLLVTFAGTLPGVFQNNPYPDAVNGSLWTLPVEACCYAMAAGLGSLGLLRRSGVLAALSCLLFLCVTPLSPLSHATVGATTAGNLTLVIMLGATFVVGGVAYSLRGRLHLSWIVVGALMVLWVATWGGGWGRVIGVLAIAYGVLVFAFRSPAKLRRMTAPGDVSYGIYVYAFPVQQSVAALWGPGLNPLLMLTISFPVTYGLAFLSWRLVERRALALKRVVAPRSPRTEKGKNGACAGNGPAPAISSSTETTGGVSELR